MLVAAAAAPSAAPAKPASAMPLAATPVDGLWLTAEGQGLVSIHPCGAHLCGWLIDRDKMHAAGPRAVHDVFIGARRPEMETLLLQGFSGGPERWGDGLITNPENGKVYESRLRLLSRDRLKVSGCILRILCGGQVWTRASTL